MVSTIQNDHHMIDSKLYIVDGSGYIFRAYHALPPLTRPDGTPVGAVYGFCSMLMRLLTTINDDKIVVVFDAGRQTFRQTLYADYKAHRPDPPLDLIPQFSLIRDVCKAFGIPNVEQAGFEADDLIAAYATQATAMELKTIVVSSDKDLMQLVNDQITMFDPIKNKPIGIQEVIEKFGVPPHQVIDVQALAGDASDNVPGVPGIGIKTASELIRSYGTLEILLENLHTVKQTKRRESLQKNTEMARISKKLVTLIHDIDLPRPIQDLKIDVNLERRIEFLKEQGFTSIINRLSHNKPSSQVIKNGPYACVQEMSLLDTIIQNIMANRVVAVDTETTGLDAMQAHLVGISLAILEHNVIHAYYIPLRHQTSESQLPITDVLAKLKPIFEHPGILKIGHNIKFDKEILAQEGVQLNPFDDTLLLSCVLDAGKLNHNLDLLASIHLNHKTTPFKEVVGTGLKEKTFDMVDLPSATRYAAEDAAVTLNLYHKLKPRLHHEHLNMLYETIERPLVPVIQSMEQTGILVNEETLQEQGKNFEKRIVQLEQEIHMEAGEVFNIGSPKQLGEILFDRMSLPGAKRSKNGSYVTDVDVLEKLAAMGHKLPTQVLAWRSLSKLKGTYVDGLLEAINPQTKRVHTSFNLAGTATGRLSSSEPNLQNIPIRSEDGKQIRRAFIADVGYKLVSLDYSQIELRLLAHMADVSALQDAFCHGVDIHSATASTVFGVPYNQITPEHRRKAKAVNFGIIYGLSSFGLSQQLGVSISEAGSMIRSYLDRYPGIEQYVLQMKSIAQKQGYVTTLFGRRCFLPTIHDRNPRLRQFAERQAVNAPLQGSNADIIKKAMIKIHRQFGGSQDVRLLLQVHDELLFEIRSHLIEHVTPKLQQIMQSIISLKVPLVVDIGIGENWREAHG